MAHRSKDVILTTVDCTECMEARVYTVQCTQTIYDN